MEDIMETEAGDSTEGKGRKGEHASVRPQLWTKPELHEQTRPGLRGGHDHCVTGIGN